MASRVNVGVQKYNMPSNIYEMSKDAHKSSIPVAIGSLTDKLGTAAAERIAAEKFAKIQRDRNNSAEANRLAKSGNYSKANYDEGYNLEFGDITEEDKTYDPFKEQVLLEEDPMLLEDPMYGTNVDDIRFIGDELFM